MPKFWQNLFRLFDGRQPQRATERSSGEEAHGNPPVEGECLQQPITNNKQPGSIHALANGGVQHEEAGGSSLQSTLETLIRYREKVQQQRELVESLQRDVDPLRTECRRRQEVYNAAAEGYSNLARRNEPTEESLLNLLNAWTSLQASFKNLNDKEDNVWQAFQILNTLEHKLQGDEQILYLNLQTLNLPTLDDFGVRSYHGELESEACSSTGSASFMPAPLREYYSKTQQASFLRGRLHELQAEQREEQEKRKLAKELNQPLPESEKAFLQTYLSTLSSMYQEYHAAQQEAMAIKLRYRQRGLDIEDGEELQSDVDVFEASTGVDRQLFHFGALNQSRFVDQNALEVLLFGYTDSVARVNSWVSHQRLKPRDNEVQLPVVSEDLAVPDPPAVDYSRAASNTVEVAESNGIARPSYSSTTKFLGEAPRRRYSDPCLYQRTLGVVELPLVPAKRPHSVFNGF